MEIEVHLHTAPHPADGAGALLAVVGARGSEERGQDAERGQELGREDAEDLPREAVADVDPCVLEKLFLLFASRKASPCPMRRRRALRGRVDLRGVDPPVEASQSTPRGECA